MKLALKCINKMSSIKVFSIINDIFFKETNFKKVVMNLIYSLLLKAKQVDLKEIFLKPN
jgi:hypothetical protein